MNLSVQLIFVILLSIAIGNGITQSLNFWYTGQDLNCSIYSHASKERPFSIDVRLLWSLVKDEYCESKNGIVILIDKHIENEKKCMEPDLRTLEINGEYLNFVFKKYKNLRRFSSIRLFV